MIRFLRFLLVNSYDPFKHYYILEKIITSFVIEIDNFVV